GSALGGGRWNPDPGPVDAAARRWLTSHRWSDRDPGRPDRRRPAAARSRQARQAHVRRPGPATGRRRPTRGQVAPHHPERIPLYGAAQARPPPTHRLEQPAVARHVKLRAAEGRARASIHPTIEDWIPELLQVEWPASGMTEE